METNPLQEIISRAKNGEPAAFAELVSLTSRFAFGTVARIVTNREESKDIVQEAYIRVWKHLGRFNGDVPFHSWFFSILRNLSIDHVRQSRRMATIASDTADPADLTGPGHPVDILEHDELNTLINKWLQTLPATQHLVFHLRDLEDLPIREVMDKTGLTEASVKSNLYIARKKLAGYLDRNGYRTK